MRSRSSAYTTVKFDNQLRHAATASAIIDAYKGEMPLHAWLKRLFSATTNRWAPATASSSAPWSMATTASAMPSGRCLPTKGSSPAFSCARYPTRRLLQYFPDDWNEKDPPFPWPKRSLFSKASPKAPTSGHRYLPLEGRALPRHRPRGLLPLLPPPTRSLPPYPPRLRTKSRRSRKTRPPSPGHPASIPTLPALMNSSPLHPPPPQRLQRRRPFHPRPRSRRPGL
jgi:hypothetical protein